MDDAKTEGDFLGTNNPAWALKRGLGSLSMQPPRSYPREATRDIAKEALYLQVETLEAGLAACRAHFQQLTRDLLAK